MLTNYSTTILPLSCFKHTNIQTHTTHKHTNIQTHKPTQHTNTHNTQTHKHTNTHNTQTHRETVHLAGGLLAEEGVALGSPVRVELEQGQDLKCFTWNLNWETQQRDT